MLCSANQFKQVGKFYPLILIQMTENRTVNITTI